MSKISWDFTEVKVAQERCKDALDQLDPANLDTPATGSVHQPLLEKKINKITKARRCQWVVAMSSLNASVGVR